MKIPASLSRLGSLTATLAVTVLREIRNIDGGVAWFTTRFLLTFIGGTVFVAFLATLKVLFFIAFLVFSMIAWIAVYNFFFHLKQRRNRQ